MIVTVCCTYLDPLTAEAVQNPPLKASTVLKFPGIIKPNLLGRGTQNVYFPHISFSHEFLSVGNSIYLQAFSSGVAEREEGE